MLGLATLPADAIFHGRYRIVRVRGAGGMGAVYEAVDETTNARRALKVMLPGVIQDRAMRARFAQEAKITGGVESDHLVRVFDAGIDEPTGTPFLVMELLSGEDLAAMLARRGPLPTGEVGDFVAQAARGLDRAHEAGIVHRDLKPGNLFVSLRDDGSPCVKILDYGLAKLATPGGETQGTQPLGTPLYMAPEQIRGKGGVGPAADRYALALIAYTLLTGEPYWDEERLGSESLFPLFTAIVEGPPEPPVARAHRRRKVELPSGLDAWFAKATALDPDARFPSAGESAAALADALDTPTARMIEVVAEVAAEGRGDWGGLGKRGVPWPWIGAAGATALGLAVVLMRPSPDAPGPARATPSAAATPAQSDKVVEDALWLVGLEDYEGAHLKLMGIPEALKPTDDPRFSHVEDAWAKWKLEQVDKATDPKQKRALLQEIIVTETVGAEQRKKASLALQALEGK